MQNHQAMLLTFKSSEKVHALSDKVLYFLEQQFPKNICPRQPISTYGKDQFLSMYGDKIMEVREQAKSTLSNKLYKHLLPLLEPENIENPTVHEIRYLESFWKNWPTVPTFKLLTEEKMVSHLICQNYNPPGLFRYIVAGIHSELSTIDDPETISQILISYARKLGSISGKVLLPFTVEHPPLKPLLYDWLKDEIKQCEKKQKHYNPKQLSILNKNDIRIETTFSVAQLVLLFRLLLQSGLIVNKVFTDVLKVICEKFSSKKVAEISMGSLHSKYYNVEDTTKDSLRQILYSLIEELDNMD